MTMHIRYSKTVFKVVEEVGEITCFTNKKVPEVMENEKKRERVKYLMSDLQLAKSQY